MQPPTAAAAIAGLKPLLIMIGIIVGPTAADRPAIEGMAVAITLVTIMQEGRRNTPSFFSGLIRRLTR